MTVPSQARPDGIPLTDTDLDAIGRCWSTDHDRGAHDYTDAGCRVLAENAFRHVPALLAEVRRGRERDAGLREALTEARKDIIAVHYAGWDSERKLFAESAVTRIDRALAATETETR